MRWGGLGALGSAGECWEHRGVRCGVLGALGSALGVLGVLGSAGECWEHWGVLGVPGSAALAAAVAVTISS